MPEKNGFEVIQELKASKNYADIPVIFITSLYNKTVFAPVTDKAH
jgi:CheY-like chemotaxis protein